MLEDLQLVISMKVIGEKNWSMISKWVPNRTDVQWRERYWNILDPKINHSNWTIEEDVKLRDAWAKLDCKWSQIAMVMGTRTDNQWWRRYNMLEGIKGNSKRKRKRVSKDNESEIREENISNMHQEEEFSEKSLVQENDVSEQINIVEEIISDVEIEKSDRKYKEIKVNEKNKVKRKIKKSNKK